MSGQDGESTARLTYAGELHGLQPCPACHRGNRVLQAHAAQGTASCAYADCAEPLYVRISYEWRDGRARLFANRFTLERVEELRGRHLTPYAPDARIRYLGSWRGAIPAGLMVGAGIGCVLAAVVRLQPLLAPVAPWVAAFAAVSAFVAATIQLSRADARERQAVHARSRIWAERLLAAPPCAVLEATDGSVLPLAGPDNMPNAIQRAATEPPTTTTMGAGPS